MWLHVYDVGHAKAIQRVDKVVQDWLGVGGIFHGAVEVYGHEWSFGATRRPATGVFCCAPRGCPMHTYRQSIYMGDCGLSAQEARARARAPPAEKRRASHAPRRARAQVHAIITRFMEEWPGTGYDLLRRNCCSFSDALCVAAASARSRRGCTGCADAGAALGDEEQLVVRRLHEFEDAVATDSRLLVSMLSKHKPAKPPPPRGGRRRPRRRPRPAEQAGDGRGGLRARAAAPPARARGALCRAVRGRRATRAPRGWLPLPAGPARRVCVREAVRSAASRRGAARAPLTPPPPAIISSSARTFCRTSASSGAIAAACAKSSRARASSPASAAITPRFVCAWWPVSARGSSLSVAS